jgi:ribosomal protein L29
MVAAKKTPAKKTVKAPEVKTIEQLRDDLVKALQDLTDSRRSHAQGELVNVHVITVQRKAVARLKTAINNESRKESK